MMNKKKLNNLKQIKVGVMAPSFVVPKIELGLGLKSLRDVGFQVHCSQQVYQTDGFYAGSAEQQAQAFLQLAYSSEIDVLWAARGGSGAIRILPFLDEWVKNHRKPPKKVFVGYSDSSILLWYLDHFWGWKSVHAPMPSLREFSILNAKQMGSIVKIVQRAVGLLKNKNSKSEEKPEGISLTTSGLQQILGFKVKSLQAPIYGGNLTTLCSIAGTKWAFAPTKKYILFIEDVSEAAYRLDRLVLQLEHSGALRHCVAIVLGTFVGCDDKVTQVLKKIPKNLQEVKISELKPLRRLIQLKDVFKTILGPISKRHGIPVFSGYPAGHGKNGHQAIQFGENASLFSP